MLLLFYQESICQGLLVHEEVSGAGPGRGAGHSGGVAPYKNDYKGDTKYGKVLKDTRSPEGVYIPCTHPLYKPLG